MPSPKKPKPRKIEDKAQSARFIATAREVETDENEKAFEKVAGVILTAKPSPPTLVSRRKG